MQANQSWIILKTPSLDKKTTDGFNVEIVTNVQCTKHRAETLPLSEPRNCKKKQIKKSKPNTKDVHITHILQLAEIRQRSFLSTINPHPRGVPTANERSSLLRTFCQPLPFKTGLRSLSQCSTSQAAISWQWTELEIHPSPELPTAGFSSPY